MLSKSMNSLAKLIGLPFLLVGTILITIAYLIRFGINDTDALLDEMADSINRVVNSNDGQY